MCIIPVLQTAKIKQNIVENMQKYWKLTKFSQLNQIAAIIPK